MGLSAAKTAAPQSAETLDAPARRSTSVLARPGEVLARRSEILARKPCECGATAGLSGRCGACDGLSLKAPGGNTSGAGASWPQAAAARHDIGHLDLRSPAAGTRQLTPLRAQTQLRVAEPGDSAEYEAQEIGRRVVAMPAPTGPPDSAASPLRRMSAGSVQRRAIKPLLASPSVVTGIDASRGHGAPLAAPVRSFMEPRFGADFSGVRVHTGPEAAALSSQLNAHAFTVGRDIYFNEGQYRPDSGAGRELIAHELTHTIQQGGVIQRSASEAPVSERTGESLHRSVWDDIKSGAAGIVNALGDPLAFLADKANMIPGFRMLTIVIGANPITMAKVDPTPANILMALIEFIPGGGLITQALQNSGVFDKVGNWIAARVKELVATVGALKAAVTSFVGSLKAADIANPGGVWDRAKRIFTEPIDRLIAFCKGVITDILKFIKDAILLPLAKLAEGTPSWDLLCAVLGKNPITGDAVDGSPEVLIGGFMKLIGQEEIWQNMQKANAIPRAFAWFKGAMAAVKAFVSAIPGKFKELFTSLTIEDVVLVAGAFKKVASVFGGFVANFMSWGLNAIWNLLEIIFDVVSPGAFAYVKKTGAALHDILKNPLPFVGNLIKAAKLGFTNFASNIVDHLKAGLIDWLTGSLPGVYIPQAFTLPEFGKLAISVLGLSWAQIRGKIVKALGPRGETIMKGLETAFDVVKALISGGVAAAWELVKEKLTGLKDMVIDAIIGFVKSAIIEKAIPKLIAMFIPGAGFISAIVSIYDTIKVFIEKLAKIAEVVKSFVDSIVAIAAGEIGGAAKRVEGALGGLLSLAISFFAGFVGLGNVASKIRDAIKKVWDMVDKGLDLAVNFIVGKAKALFAYLFAGKDQKPETGPDAHLNDATFAEPFSMGPEGHTIKADLHGGALKVTIASVETELIPALNAAIAAESKDTGRPESQRNKILSELNAALSRSQSIFSDWVAAEARDPASGNRKVAYQRFMTNRIHEIVSTLRRLEKYNITDIQKIIAKPTKRFIPAGIKIRPLLYDRATGTQWRAESKKFRDTEKSALSRDVFQIANKRTTNLTEAQAEWNALLSKKILDPDRVPTFTSYDHAKHFPLLEYETDHKTSLGVFWNNGEKDKDDSARAATALDQNNWQLLTAAENAKKSGEDFDREVGANFSSIVADSPAGSDTIGGKPFLDRPP